MAQSRQDVYLKMTQPKSVLQVLYFQIYSAMRRSKCTAYNKADISQYRSYTPFANPIRCQSERQASKMGFSGWFAEMPFSISGANSRGKSSTGPVASSSGAGVDDGNRSSERQDQRYVVFDPNATRVVLPMEPQPAFTIDAGQELPQLNVPQPYVNPLAGMVERPDPELSKEEKRDAYAQMMKRFQVGDLEVWHPQSRSP